MREQELCASIFSEGGLIAKSLPSFQKRKEQEEMATAVFRSYTREEIVLIEAGTGTGKSLAYLFPAIYHALKNQTKTVIATKTIALQEQLLFKDIPFLIKILQADCKVMLVKGMGNYVCLRKLHEHLDQLLLIPSSERKELESIEEIIETKGKGSFSDFPFSVSPAIKEKVCAESDSCNRNQCHFYQECIFFKERAQAADAQILVVNHHLLLADLKQKLDAPGKDAILPSFDRLVLDEAHHFEQIAIESLAEKWQRQDTFRALSRLHSEANLEKSRLFLIRQEISAKTALPTHVQTKLEIDLPAQKHTCQVHLDEFFRICQEFISLFSQAPSGRLRITPTVLSHPGWIDVQKQGRLFADELIKGSLLIRGLLSDLEPLQEMLASSLLNGHLSEIKAIQERLEKQASLILSWLQAEIEIKKVRFAEWNPYDMTLVNAHLDISTLLADHLFAKLKGALLCSATLAAHNSFSSLKVSLGLDSYANKLQEHILQSPFDYQKRTLFAIPTDFPLPTSPSFFSSFLETAAEMIQLSQGSVLILFTSYEMLKKSYEALQSLTSYPLLRQGEMPRTKLLEQFRKSEGSVLLATDSFWEGVDIPGEALRCVIIVKLPFAVPDDPLHEAYAELLQKEGKDPFHHYTLAHAIIKFKQGFGRLMRRHEDRGCVVCLDTRLATKGYGKKFLASLPPSKLCFAPKKEVLDQMQQLYKMTAPNL